jgi:hypothetical protein
MQKTRGIRAFPGINAAGPLAGARVNCMGRAKARSQPAERVSPALEFADERTQLRMELVRS